MQILPSLRRILAGLCGLTALAFATHPLKSQTTGPQQLIFAGLLGSTNPNPADPANAQFNAVQSDTSGNLYLLLDQKDGDAGHKQSARQALDDGLQQRLKVGL